MEDALGWLRDNDLDYDDLDLGDVQSISAMSKMNSVVAPDEDRSAFEVAGAMESALDWLCSNDAAKDFSLDYLSPASKGSKRSFGSGRISQLSDERRAKDMENALGWLRANEATKVSGYDAPSLISFATMGGKMGGIPEGVRAKDVTSTMVPSIRAPPLAAANPRLPP